MLRTSGGLLLVKEYGAVVDSMLQVGFMLPFEKEKEKRKKLEIYIVARVGSSCTHNPQH